MVLSEREIKGLITNCKLQVESAYRGKLDDCEYFKRGFLLATKEITDLMANVLNQYEIKPNE